MFDGFCWEISLSDILDVPSIDIGILHLYVHTYLPVVVILSDTRLLP